MIECNIENCKMRYIGQTQRALKYRLSEHRGYANTGDVDKTTGAHFNLPGHSQANMRITVIEEAKKSNKTYREIREKYHINFFNTFYKGLNQKQ